MFVTDDVKEAVCSFFSLKSPPRIDSLLFRSLRYASIVTGVACVLVTARTYIGDNINCTTMTGNNDGELEAAIESYCFISATFTLANHTVVPAAVAHPGVGPVPHREYFPPGTGTNFLPPEDQVTRHSYYQWVPFMLVLQSLLLYLPWTLWNNKENNYLDKMLSDTHHVHVDKVEGKEKNKASVDYFAYSMRHNNGSYFKAFLLYEVIGAAFAVGNLFLTNTFLGGKFFYFGIGVSKYLTSSVTDINNPLNEVFPKVGKCTWFMFGPTGTIVSRDSLCILPLNIVNEKTYIVLCFAYMSLAVVASLALLYHVYLYAIPGRLDARILANTAPHRNTVRGVLTYCDRGDKFILWNLREYIVDFPNWINGVVEASKAKRN